MSAVKHTPGPLSVRRGDNYLAEVYTTTARGSLLVLARVTTPQGDRAKGLANADMFATAPALADALENLARFVRHDDDCASLEYVAEVNDVKGFECDCGAEKAQAAAHDALRAAGRL